MLVDPFGRHVTYLRVSVTDRCDLRCTYCMAEHMTFLPKRELLTLEELDRLCTAFVERGVKKLRITGGEPLVRRDVMKLMRALSRHLDSGALEELTLTTNANRLDKHAAELADIGVKRINVSLDSLDPDRFRAITRTGNLHKVLRGIKAAKDAGIAIKLNAVALAGLNEDELPHMVEWAHGEGHDITFIETMPMGEIDEDRTMHYLPLSVLRERFEERWSLVDIPLSTGGPARYVKAVETGGRIGFITRLTHNFCEGCNRVRLTCTGMLYMCLGQEDSADLRKVVRECETDRALHAALDEAIARKPKGHDFIIDRGAPKAAVPRHMSVTGG